LQLKRRMIVMEILNTEQAYVHSMDVVIKIVVNPLKEALVRGTPILSREEIRDIFFSLEVIHKVNAFFLEKLDGRVNINKGTIHDVVIADLFEELASQLKAYSQYVNNYDIAVRTFSKCLQTKPEFNKFIQECYGRPELKFRDVFDFLIQPVQRVPRYVLLLTELHKYTPKEHASSSKLKRALVKMKNVTTKLNEAKREAEATNKVMSIEEKLIQFDRPLAILGRKFIKEGSLIEETKGASNYVYIFLFSDLLLLTQQQALKFQVMTTIDASQIQKVLSVASSIPSKKTERVSIRNLYRLRLVYKQDKTINITFLTSSEQEKIEWCDAITYIIGTSQSIKTKKKQKQKK